MAIKMRLCTNCRSWFDTEISTCPNCGNVLTITEYTDIYFNKTDSEKRAIMVRKYISCGEEDDNINYGEDGVASNMELQEEKRKALASMLITSGFTFDGYTITKYSGYISGDDVVQVSRGLSIFGSIGTTNTGEELTNALVKIRRRALQELKEAAYNLGCNAVIGVDFDYITIEPETANLGGGTTYLPYVFCVTANGNAVVIEKNAPKTSLAEVLKEYKDLLELGIITEEEFNSKKRELLN